MLVHTIVGALMLLCLTGRGTAECNPGWNDINGFCYAFYEPQLLDWNQTSYFCENLNAQTARIDSAQTFRGIYEYIKTYGLTGSFWLGGSDIEAEGDWVWANGDKVPRGTGFWALDSGILNWSLEPQGGEDQNCLAMDEERFFYWDDRSCFLNLHPLCQQ